MSVFKGAGVAIATPFHEDGSVNYEEFGRLIDFQIDNGTDAIVVCGTTGESATLTEDEHVEVIRYCVQHVNHRISVVAGAGSNSTETAKYLSREAQTCGADAILSVTPYYNKATQDGLIAHYTAIARSTDLPVIVYNVPSRTGTNVLPETMAQLYREVDNIVGIKDAVGNLAQTSKMMSMVDEGFELYSGEDGLIVPLMSLGALGVISVLSNVAPKQTHDICRMALEGDFKGAAALQLKALPLIDALFCEVNPIPVKAALPMIGIQAGPLRLPLTPLSEAHHKLLEQEMRRFGLIA
ncbi:MAG: 4-hydroxy-tetrahydrodipicolinate synthase [Butyrivibrio sp.]|nr:4-hydroxy-tetrahydrodipicolinate synthase [Butyrivibrio sp.]